MEALLEAPAVKGIADAIDIGFLKLWTSEVFVIVKYWFKSLI